MNENIELKPCPFCGGEASTKVAVIHGTVADHIIFKIYCYECKIERYVNIQSGSIFEEAEKAKQDVIEAWNRRIDNG